MATHTHATKDPWQVLGIPERASLQEAKLAFKRLAVQRHPDKRGGSEVAFKELVAAYEYVQEYSLASRARRREPEPASGSRGGTAVVRSQPTTEQWQRCMNTAQQYRNAWDNVPFWVRLAWVGLTLVWVYVLFVAFCLSILPLAMILFLLTGNTEHFLNSLPLAAAWGAIWLMHFLKVPGKLEFYLLDHYSRKHM